MTANTGAVRLDELAAWAAVPAARWPAVLVVDLRAARRTGGEVAAVEAALRAAPCPVVGVHGTWEHDPVTEAFARAATCTLAAEDGADAPPAWVVPVPDPDAAAHELCTSVGANPRAAAVAAQVLTTSASLPAREGLLVESWAYATLQSGAEHRRWLGSRSRTRRGPGAPGEVRLERDGDVLRVTLDRPERRNALDAAARQALHDALDVARVDPGVRVVLTGAGPSFCSGGDLDEFGSVTSPSEGHRIRVAAGPAFAMAAVAARVRAEVHGSVVGAGLELAAFADHVVATPDATFRLPELAMGLIPGAGGTVSVTRRVGRWRTAWLILTGATVGAPTARRWGMVDEVR